MEFNTICELVDKASATYGRKLLYKTETSSIAYKELTPMVDNYAINLNDVKGEKIGILSENRFEWEIAFFAILKSGNIVVVQPIEESPAEKVGILSGDIIVEVNEVRGRQI